MSRTNRSATPHIHRGELQISAMRRPKTFQHLLTELRSLEQLENPPNRLKVRGNISSGAIVNAWDDLPIAAWREGRFAFSAEDRSAIQSDIDFQVARSKS